ncbi:MAG: hypothetical protein LQ343_000954 [Gyalolechia ehrenbergii]|nr:MAG: hypothetical protein LQ343_000954 [Gyalolechia ehrenbergii]
MGQRYIPNNPSKLLKAEEPGQELVLSLEKLLQGYPPQDTYSRHEEHGLYSGPTSIAYLFLHLSITHPALIVGGHHCKSWCKAYLSGDRHLTHVSADKCGIINESLAFPAVHAALTGDQRYIDVLESHAASIAQEPNGSDEWLYGRAGFLYLLRLVRHWVPSSEERMNACIRRVGDRIVEDGPRWKWHGKEYLGAVHGPIGIITQLVLSDPNYAAHPKVTSVFRDLLQMQDQDTGNFPSSIDSGKDYLVQFCHGAPGFALSIPLIRQYFDDTIQGMIDAAMVEARKCIWEKGLLTKEPNLCHGATANALALTSPQREHFMAYATAAMITKGKVEGWYLGESDPYGLFCGEAGRAWGWAVLEVEKDMRIIGYSDI